MQGTKWTRRRQRVFSDSKFTWLTEFSDPVPRESKSRTYTRKILVSLNDDLMRRRLRRERPKAIMHLDDGSCISPILGYSKSVRPWVDSSNRQVPIYADPCRLHAGEAAGTNQHVTRDESDTDHRFQVGATTQDAQSTYICMYLTCNVFSYTSAGKQARCLHLILKEYHAERSQGPPPPASDTASGDSPHSLK